MSCDHIDKNQLVMLCKAGDQEAQGQLYTTYRRKMMKVIRQYVADYDMAQDVLHDGFIIILSQIQNLRNLVCLCQTNDAVIHYDEPLRMYLSAHQKRMCIPKRNCSYSL
jgi:hypothetical protein